MSMQDPIADMFTRIKNSQAVTKKQVTIPGSKIKTAIAKLLKEEGYIVSYQVSNLDNKSVLEIELKYYQGKPVIGQLKRFSRSGTRVYKSADKLPKILDGLGVAIISTSKGLMTDRKARSLKQGGEIIGVIA